MALWTLNVWLLRHAQVPGSADYCMGRCDWPADPIATSTAAQQFAATWFEQGAARWPTLWYCSPAARCQQLARAVQRCLAPELIEWVTTESLVERNYGRWEGRAWTTLHESAYSAWARDPTHFQPPEGESAWQLKLRIIEAWQSSYVPAAQALLHSKNRLRDGWRSKCATDKKSDTGDTCNMVLLAHAGPLSLLAQYLTGTEHLDAEPMPLGTLRQLSLHLEITHEVNSLTL